MELPTVTYMMKYTSFSPSHILFMVYIFWLSCHLAIFLLLPVSQSEGSFFNRTCLLTTGLEYINFGGKREGECHPEVKLPLHSNQ